MEKIYKDIYYVGCNDTSQALFDALVPIKNGTSYNSYLLFGTEGTALIDTSEKSDFDVYFKTLEQFENLTIDYMIMLHTEPDHSSLIPEVMRRHPEAKIVCSGKGCELYQQFYGSKEDDKFIIAKEGDLISLGNKTIEFYQIPFSHWPDQMVAYAKEDKILFSSDFFGSHHTIGNSVLIDNDPEILLDAKTYYGQIMMPLINHARKNFLKIKQLDIDLIAPAHGPIFKDKTFIMDAYEKWTDNAQRDKTAIIFASAHGTTASMANLIYDELIKRNDNVAIHDVEFLDFDQLILDLVDCKSIVVGSSCIQSAAHPKLLSELTIINALKPNIEDVHVFGSYSWGQNITQTIRSALSNVCPIEIDELFIKGPITEENKADITHFISKIN